MYFGKQTAPPCTENESVLSNTNVLWIWTIGDIWSDLGSFRQQPGADSALIKQQPHHRCIVIGSLTSWNQMNLFEGDNQGLNTTLWLFMWGIPTSGFIMAVALKLLSHWGYGPPMALVPATAIVQYQAKVCYHLFYFSKQWANPHPFTHCWLHDPPVYMETRVNNNAAMERGQVESHIKIGFRAIMFK